VHKSDLATPWDPDCTRADRGAYCHDHGPKRRVGRLDLLDPGERLGLRRRGDVPCGWAGPRLTERRAGAPLSAAVGQRSSPPSAHIRSRVFALDFSRAPVYSLEPKMASGE
jgi:hypothetical protein